MAAGETDLLLLGDGDEPALVIPGGPLLGPEYLGDLGGLASRRPLALARLPRLPLSQLTPAVRAAADQLSTGPIDLVTHSAGAPVALLFLREHPERVRSLLLITPAATAAGVEPDQDGIDAVLARRSAEPGFADAVQAAYADHGSLEGQRISYGVWGEEQRALAAATLVEREERLATFYAEPRVDPGSLRDAAADFTGAVTILHGELDVHPTRRQAEELASLFPNADLISLPQAGHFPWLDDQAAFLDAALAGLDA